MQILLKIWNAVKPYVPWLIILIVSFMWGRSCNTSNYYEKELKDSKAVVKLLKAQIENSELKVAELQLDNEKLSNDVKDKDIELEELKEESDEIARDFENELKRLAGYTPQQIDSALSARFPDTSPEDLNRKVVEELTEFDRTKKDLSVAVNEIQLLESQKLSLQKMVVNEQQINEQLQLQISNLKQINGEKDSQIDSYKKHIRKLKRQKFGAIAGGTAIAVLGILVAL